MSAPKDIPIAIIKQIASKAISYYNVNNEINDFTEEQLIRLCATADPALLNDRTLVDNETIRRHVRWTEIPTVRVCRIMARLHDLGHNDIMDDIDTSGLRVRIKDIKPLIQRVPEMISRFNINMDRLSDIDACMLLEMGKDYFLHRVSLKGRRLSPAQQHGICKAYGYRRDVLQMFDPRGLDGFYAAEIIRNTGRTNLDLLDLKILKLTDWVSVLEVMPELYALCEPERFFSDLIMPLIDLAVLMNDEVVYEAILSRDLKEVSPLGWEKLMSHRPEVFKELCDYAKLDEVNRRNILLMQPELDLPLNARPSFPISSREEPSCSPRSTGTDDGPSDL